MQSSLLRSPSGSHNNCAAAPRSSRLLLPLAPGRSPRHPYLRHRSPRRGPRAAPRRVQAGACEGGRLALGSAVSATMTVRSGVRWARRGRGGEGLLPWFWVTCQTFGPPRCFSAFTSDLPACAAQPRVQLATRVDLAAPRLPSPPPGPGLTFLRRVCLRRRRGRGRGSRSAPAAIGADLPTPRLPPQPSGPRTRWAHRLLSLAKHHEPSIRPYHTDRTTSAREWVAAHGGRGRLTTHSVGGTRDLFHCRSGALYTCLSHLIICSTKIRMAAPVFLEYDADGTIRTNRLHWEGFPRLAWEALSAAGYTVPPVYEVTEFERLGVPRCRVTVTVSLHPVHPKWFDLSFVYWGFRGHESVESAALRVLTDFCDHNPTVVALSPFGLFPAVSPHDPAWLDRVDHLQELLLLAEPLDVTSTLTRCLDVLFTLQGLRCTTASIVSQRLESARLAWHSLSAAYQQQSFTLFQTQQENDWLRPRRFQLELEQGDHLQRILDLEAQTTTLQEDVDVRDIERLTLLQNIAEMQQQVEETEVQVAALQAIVALQPPPPVEAPPEEQQGQSGLDQESQAGPLPPTPPASPAASDASVGN